MIGVVGLLIWNGRKQTARKADRARALGFSPVEFPDPRLAARVERIYQIRQNVEIELHNVYEHTTGDARIFMIDILDTGGEDSSWLGQEMIAIISPYLELPRFFLMSKVQMNGMFVDTMNEALHKLADYLASRQGLTPITFQNHPELEERFMIYADDEREIHRFFNDYRLDQLARLEAKYEIDALGDTMIMKNCYPEREDDPDYILRETYRTAFDLFRLFQE